MEWITFTQELWSHQTLPQERKYLLLQVAARPEQGIPPAVAVGYMRFAAGDKDSPTFTIPGVGGEVVAWCNCLPDHFFAPLWAGTHKPDNAEITAR